MTVAISSRGMSSIRAITMTEGSFSYEVRVVDKENQELTASALEFAAVGSAVPDDGI